MYYLYADKKQIEDFLFLDSPHNLSAPNKSEGSAAKFRQFLSFFMSLQQRQEYTAPAACFRDSRKFLSVD